MTLNWIEKEFKLRTRASMFLENLDTGIGQFWDELKQSLRTDIVTINQHWMARVGGGPFSIDDSEGSKIQIWKHSWPGFEVTITLERKAESLRVKWARIDPEKDQEKETLPAPVAYTFELYGKEVAAKAAGGHYSPADLSQTILLPLIRANEHERIEKLLTDPSRMDL